MSTSEVSGALINPVVIVPTSRPLMYLPYSRQDVSKADVAAVVEALNADFLTQGPRVIQFEQSVANLVGARFAAAMNSATSALHSACHAVGVGAGDRVWTSPITFVASANCAVFCGAQVEFVDIDRDTFNISTTALAEKLEDAKRRRQLPKALVVVHLGGTPCDVGEIRRLVQSCGVRVIEDASHALGARRGAEPVGSCHESDVTVFSFHPVKMITTAEGGMAVTNDPSLNSTMQRFRSHGITRNPFEMAGAPDGPWYYEQIELGFNYRMPDLFAALGLSQLRRLEHFVTRRNEIAEEYRRLLDPADFTLQFVPEGTRSSRHLVIAIPNYERLRTSQRELFERLRSRGIMANLHYIPIYRHPFHRARLVSEPDCPNAEWYYARAITLPCFPGMTTQDVETVALALNEPVGHQTIF